jgi:hypothetical protein
LEKVNFENFNISKNNKICVEGAKVVNRIFIRTKPHSRQTLKARNSKRFDKIYRF